MIAYLTCTINQYMPLLLDVNKEYNESFYFDSDGLYHTWKLKYNWRQLDSTFSNNRKFIEEYGHTHNSDRFLLPRNY